MFKPETDIILIFVIASFYNPDSITMEQKRKISVTSQLENALLHVPRNNKKYGGVGSNVNA